MLSYAIFHLLKLCDQCFCSQRNKQGQDMCIYVCVCNNVGHCEEPKLNLKC